MLPLRITVFFNGKIISWPEGNQIPSPILMAWWLNDCFDWFAAQQIQAKYGGWSHQHGVCVSVTQLEIFVGTQNCSFSCQRTDCNVISPTNINHLQWLTSNGSGLYPIQASFWIHASEPSGKYGWFTIDDYLFAVLVKPFICCIEWLLFGNVESPGWLTNTWNYTTQYTEDYNNPIGKSVLPNQYIGMT